jgi:hypothetical protein
MHSLMSRRRDERGAVAIVVALSLTAILVIAALTLDFGLVRVDRQVDKSAADSAVLAGLHALNGGDANPRPFVGVCTAINYMQQNNSRFSGLSPTAGTWTNGANTPLGIANPCTDPTYQAMTCTPGDNTSWAKFTWLGTQDGKPLNVVIQSGYLLSGTSGYSEDSLPAASADNNDLAEGCDQLAVLIDQTREPGVGSLAVTGDIKSAVRSVGRVKSVPGGYAPAMLLLKQTGCDVLGGANNNTKVYLAGAYASNGLTQPGTIHSDSDASGCGNNTYVYAGKQADNIVAFAAPLFATPTLPDTSKPGQITLFGGSGQTSHYYDSTTNVCGTDKLYTTPVATGLCPSTTSIGTGGRVYRKVVDERYLTAVKTIRDNAESEFAVAPTYSKIISGNGNCNNPPAALSSGLTAADKLYVNCATFGPNSAVTLNAGTIVFAGAIVNPTSLSMPNAKKVYVAGDSTVAANKNGISLGNGRTFAMNNAAGNLSSGQCSSAATGPETNALTTNKSVLVVKNGTINMTGGSTFRACYTTVVMLSGKGATGGNACMPSSPSTAAPSANPCTGSAYTPGTGQLNMSGGNIDWTAPNQHDVMVDSVGSPNPTFAGAWADTNGPEDLAFWSESANGNPAYQLTGGGTVHLVGVFMIPNAEPMTLAGQFSQQLVNAQFIASSISLSGGSTISMKVDPGSAVTLPRLDIVGLVR